MGATAGSYGTSSTVKVRPEQTSRGRGRWGRGECSRRLKRGKSSCLGKWERGKGEGGEDRPYRHHEADSDDVSLAYGFRRSSGKWPMMCHAEIKDRRRSCKQGIRPTAAIPLGCRTRFNHGGRWCWRTRRRSSRPSSELYFADDPRIRTASAAAPGMPTSPRKPARRCASDPLLPPIAASSSDRIPPTAPANPFTN